jgi:hypothetical protein
MCFSSEVESDRTEAEKRGGPRRRDARLGDLRTGAGPTRDETHRGVGVRLSSGFFGRTRFQVLYAYDFDVRRPDSEGGYELSAHITGYF